MVKKRLNTSAIIDFYKILLYWSKLPTSHKMASFYEMLGLSCNAFYGRIRLIKKIFPDFEIKNISRSLKCNKFAWNKMHLKNSVSHSDAAHVHEGYNFLHLHGEEAAT
jgi:hypothetical protein